MSKTGRTGGYVYVGYDDPAKTSYKAVAERRAQVRVLAEIGLTPARTAARLGLPTTTVEADLAAIKRDGHGRSTTGRAA